jgi:hypothetical protein
MALDDRSLEQLADLATRMAAELRTLAPAEAEAAILRIRAVLRGRIPEDEARTMFEAFSLAYELVDAT